MQEIQQSRGKQKQYSQQGTNDMELLDYLKEFSSDFDDLYEGLIKEIYNNLK